MNERQWPLDDHAVAREQDRLLHVVSVIGVSAATGLADEAKSRPRGESSRTSRVDESAASRAPFLTLAAIVIGAFISYVVLVGTVESPRVFSDELLYFDAAGAVVEREGLTVRGQDYLYAPLYPLLLVPAHWIGDDRQDAYELAKLLNAFLFALTAVPAFALARRLLPRWPSVAVATLVVAIPSASYGSVVMTESLAYLVCTSALYVVLLALEKPTVLRQFGALAVIAVASGVRTQFFVLFAAYVLGLVLALIVPRRRLRGREAARALWPTLIAVVLGVAIALSTIAREGSGPLGVYSVLWRGYDPLDVGRWFVYHLANLELYLGVVPFVVAPIVLVVFLRRGREGDERQAAFVALFVAANVVFLSLTAAFNSTEFAVDSLHDRALFYVMPLWLVLLFAWLGDGAPKPRYLLAVGAAIALALPLLLPFSEYAKDDARQQFNGVGTTLWATLEEAFDGFGRVIMVGVVVSLVLATSLARGRARLLPLAVVAILLLGSALNWSHASRVAETWSAVVPESERRWLDERVPEGRTVTVLAAVETCPDFTARDGFYLSEFFNAAVTRAAHVGTPPDSLPAEKVGIGRDGAVVLDSGEPLDADFVLVQPGVPIDGRRIAEGTTARLVLWEVGGAVRAPRVTSDVELQELACRQS